MPPPPPRTPGRRRRGCLISLGVLAGLVVVAIIAVSLISQASSRRQTSGRGIIVRPTSTTPPPTETSPDTSRAQGETVHGLARDELLVSVANNPPRNPCGTDGPDHDIEVIRDDGSGRRALSTDASRLSAVNTDDEEIWPRLSPDRRRFVFYRSPRGKTGETCRYTLQELWIANVDATGVRPLFTDAQKDAVASANGWAAGQALQGHADWAPDGRHLVMVLGAAPPGLLGIPNLGAGETQLFVLDVDTGALRQVTRRLDNQGRGLSSDPSFSADGSQIVFVGCPDREVGACSDMQILAVASDADRATTTSVVFDGPGRNANDVYVSPDGRSILWMEVGVLETKLYVAPFTPGREVRPADATLVDNHAGYANWTPDSAAVIYSPLRLGERFSLWINRFDGQPSRRISPSPTSESFMFPSP